MRRARARLHALLAALVFALPLRNVEADSERAPARGEAERRLVSVTIAGEPASVAAVLDVLRERAADAGVEATFETVPAIDRASVVTPGAPNDRQLARIWIDLTLAAPEGEEPAPITLYVVDGSWERVLVRPIRRHANLEITWEEVGHIVELAMGALRAGESIGVGRAVAREQLLPSPPPSVLPTMSEPPSTANPPPSAAPIWRLGGGGFYAVSAYGDGLELATGPGLLLGLSARRRGLELGGMLTAEYRLPSSVEHGSARLLFEGGAVHALASGAVSVNERSQLLLGVGAGVEIVHARGTSSDRDNVRFRGGELETVPVTRLILRYAFATPPLRLFAGIGADAPFRRPRYLLSRDDAPVVLFEPWFVRPFILIGVETD